MRTILIALLMTLTTQVGAEEPLSRYVLVAYFQVDEKTPALAPLVSSCGAIKST